MAAERMIKDSRARKGMHDVKDVLLIGLEGVGKTIIMRRLMDLDAEDLNSYTRSTVGLEREEVKINNNSYLIAEYGSKMVANWNKMYDSSK